MTTFRRNVWLARWALASSAHFVSSSTIEDSAVPSFTHEAATSGAHSAGKVVRSSANSPADTTGQVHDTDASPTETLASNAPWPQTRTLSPATVCVPAGAGRCTDRLTSDSETSSRVPTNCQYSSATSLWRTSAFS